MVESPSAEKSAMDGRTNVENPIASLGGKAAAAKLSPAHRRERAKLPASARGSGNLPRATHGDSDHPLRIGNIEIPCYVLDDGRRVITQRGFQAALGMNA